MRNAVLLLTATVAVSTFATNEGSLVQLIEQGSIALSPVGLGGHAGECLRVAAENLTTTALRTTIPAGWVFVSEDAGIQDLMVARDEPLVLLPKGRLTVTCRAFCCEAGQGSPRPEETYRKGHPARADLFALAQAIDSGRYDDDLVQHAIWVLSDGNDIGSMGALDGSTADRLRERVSRLSRQPVPLYTVRYAPGGDRACSQRPERITRTLRLANATPQHITVVVRSDDGRFEQVLYDGLLLPAGVVDLPLQVDVLDRPQGRYAFHVHSVESNTVRRLPFTL